MKTPRAEITVNGKPVASAFNDRLISVTIVDKEGTSGDTITCDLNDGMPFAQIPRKGDEIGAKLGYLETGVADFGTYISDDPEVACLPYGMTITGTSANVRGQAKQHRSRHWDNKTVKQIVEQIAGENGLSSRIDEEVSSHKYKWFGQQDESDLHVVQRLAQRHDALFTIKNKTLIFKKKGEGVGAVVASPANIVEGTCRTVFAHRYKYKKVKARWQDRNEAKLKEVEEDSDSEGEATYTIAESFQDEGEAKKAAKAKAKDLKRETMRTSVTLYGDPAIRAGAKFVYAGVRPEIDGVEFIIESAAHKLSKAGYTVDVEAKLKV